MKELLTILLKLILTVGISAFVAFEYGIAVGAFLFLICDGVKELVELIDWLDKNWWMK